MKNTLTTLVLLFSVSATWAQAAEKTIDYDRSIAPYFVAELSPQSNDSIDGGKRMTIQREHLAYIKTLAEEGKLVLAGPFQGGGGLFFLKAKDRDEAEALIKADPSVKAGLENYTLRLWFTEKGLFTLDNQATDSE